MIIFQQDKSCFPKCQMSQNIRVSLGCFSLETHPTVHAFYHRPSPASWFFPPTFAGWAKGKGFVGRIKKWGGKRGPMTHGSKHHRRKSGWCGWGQGSQVIHVYFFRNTYLEIVHIFVWKKNMKDLRERIGWILWKTDVNFPNQASFSSHYFLFGQTRTTPPHFTLKASLVQESPHSISQHQVLYIIYYTYIYIYAHSYTHPGNFTWIETMVVWKRQLL